jgi:hypothetical protein
MSEIINNNNNNQTNNNSSNETRAQYLLTMFEEAMTGLEAKYKDSHDERKKEREKQSEYQKLLRNKVKERKLFPERYEPYQTNKKQYQSWTRKIEYKDIPIMAAVASAVPANTVMKAKVIKSHKDGYNRKVYTEERKTCRVESCDNEIEKGRQRGSYCIECKDKAKLKSNQENVKKRITGTSAVKKDKKIHPENLEKGPVRKRQSFIEQFSWNP